MRQERRKGPLRRTPLPQTGQGERKTAQVEVETPLCAVRKEEERVRGETEKERIACRQ